MKRLLFRAFALIILLPLTGGVLTGCREVDQVEYMVYQRFGVEKSDLFHNSVKDALGDQKKAKKEFEDALTALRQTYQSPDTPLSQRYDLVKSKYDASKSALDGLKARIDKMDRIANDLFAEWKTETGQLRPELQSDSLQRLASTKERYLPLKQSLDNSYNSAEKALSEYHQYVLYLKHLNNEASVDGLKTESGDIQARLQELITQISGSIDETEKYIQQGKAQKSGSGT